MTTLSLAHLLYDYSEIYNFECVFEQPVNTFFHIIERKDNFKIIEAKYK